MIHNGGFHQFINSNIFSQLRNKKEATSLWSTSKVASQVWNLYIPMGQVQYVGNPYSNTYDLQWPYHPYLSMEKNQDVPQPPQLKKPNLEHAMAQLANAMAEMKNYHAQMATLSLKKSMAEMSKS